VFDAGELLRHHPWWAAAGVVMPVLIAAWVMAGSRLLEARHAAELFGERR
jgi:hypothetical protein